MSITLIASALECLHLGVHVGAAKVSDPYTEYCIVVLLPGGLMKRYRF